MTSCIRHRGPDAEGHQLFPEVGLALGHRRLAIVDLSPAGSQPMDSASGRYSIVFNGEIYNFRTLRRALENEGHAFRGTSDTEVMLAAFEQHGVEKAVPQFAGMFAFALWDNQEQQLWLGRDRMGEKPLYVGQFDGIIAFGSELKSIRSLPGLRLDVDPVAIADVLERGYIRGSRTIYKGVTKVEPGALVCVEREKNGYKSELVRYWSVAKVRAATNAESDLSDDSRPNAADKLDALLREVIADEMIADVPVGAFLSGGIDSSLVVALMQQVSSRPVRTFTVGFDDASVDESEHAKVVAAHLGTQHTAIRLSAAAALDVVGRLPAIFDEPFADPSELPTLMICEATRKHVTVALSGDGGDELFGGYSQYLGEDSIGKAIRRVPAIARGAVAAGAGVLPDAAWRAVLSGDTWAPNARARVVRAMRTPGSASIHEGLLSNWADPASIMAERHGASVQERELEVSWPETTSYQEAQMEYDMQTYLPDDILVKVDRSAMSVSLETRAPLLDHRVVEFALKQPLVHKISEGTGKTLLRDVLHRYLPAKMWDRPKQGFTIPLASWLRAELREWGEEMLRADQLLSEWFRPEKVKSLWEAHQGGENHADRLWRILLVMQWLRAQEAGVE